MQKELTPKWRNPITNVRWWFICVYNVKQIPVFIRQLCSQPNFPLFNERSWIKSLDKRQVGQVEWNVNLCTAHESGCCTCWQRENVALKLNCCPFQIQRNHISLWATAADHVFSHIKHRYVNVCHNAIHLRNSHRWYKLTDYARLYLIK